jgi:putative NADH-flavin reductase
MTLTVFGATGRTGQPVVRQALDAGHTVVAFARTPSKLDVQHDNLAVVQGDVTDAASVKEAVDGADAVVSVLGHAEGAPDDVVTVGTRHILDAMRAHGVQRLVSMTGAAVQSEKDPSYWGSNLAAWLMETMAPAMIEDERTHAEVIRASDFDWTIVRAPRLTDGPYTGTYRTGYLKMGLGASISRTDVADFLLRLATSDEYVGEEPMLHS